MRRNSDSALITYGLGFAGAALLGIGTQGALDMVFDKTLLEMVIGTYRDGSLVSNALQITETAFLPGAAGAYLAHRALKRKYDDNTYYTL